MFSWKIRPWRACLLAIALSMCIDGQTACWASLTTAPLPTFELESGNAAASAPTDPGESSQREADGNWFDHNLAADSHKSGPSSGGAGSSTSGSSGNVGATVFLPTSTVHLPDFSPSGALALQHSLFITQANGMDLLRPPQAA